MNVKNIYHLVKAPQSILALPWALSGALAAFLRVETEFSVLKIFWIALAFIGARTAGMAANRLIDAHIDAMNPRTANRALPSGLVSRTQVVMVALAFSCLFVFSAGQINSLCLWISPLPLSLIWFYSWTKRFTCLCHLVLGFIEFLAPVCGWIALAGSFTSAPLFLGGAFFCLITGFDILYALQDLEFDRKHAIHSLPVYLGKEKAVLLAQGLHGSSVLFLLSFAFIMQLNVLYFFGCAWMAGLLFYFHWDLFKEENQRISTGFFQSLSWISSIQFFALLTEVDLWHVM